MAAGYDLVVKLISLMAAEATFYGNMFRSFNLISMERCLIDILLTCCFICYLHFHRQAYLR
ncbi:hypothetical protein AB833_28250 [Chromatiales bacterium (ex Bugula neritina AB1)]|nr:hypothetical protein AB833_28250 [Chromatiales bacterium (ex Bugula neritina AB1)]